MTHQRDRLLKPRGEDYAPADFALCFVCHAENGFAETTSGTTGFFDNGHDKHLMRIATDGNNPTTSIDVEGAGRGNAICSECHFRTHGTALAYRVGDRANQRLVNFAPNVEPLGGVNGVPKFTKTATGGSCTLICHGESHNGESY